MKKVFIFIYAVAITLCSFATGQDGDIIFVDNERWELLGEPVYADSVLTERLKTVLPKDRSWSTANWKGYTGYWSIKKDILYLDSIQIGIYDKETRKTHYESIPDGDMRRVFKEHYKRGRIKAGWYTGKIRIAHGGLLHYEHMGFARNYEHELVLNLSRGKVFDRKVSSNRLVCEGFAFNDKNLTTLSKAFSHSKNYPELAKVDKGFTFMVKDIRVDSLGNLIDCKVGLGRNMENKKLEDEIKATLMTIHPWRTIFLDGEYTTPLGNRGSFMVPFSLIKSSEQDEYETLARHNIYVSVEGDDSAEGTKDTPVRTFERAQMLARKAKGPVRVWFGNGTYYLTRTIVFDSHDNHVVYCSQNPQGAVISGGSRLSLKWREEKNGIWSAQTDSLLTIDQLFVNGKCKRMARYPNISQDKEANVFDRWRLNEAGDEKKDDALSEDRIARWQNPAGGYIHAMHEYLWGDMHWIIKGKENGNLNTEGGWQNNRPSRMHPHFRIVENIREELDEPGEWYYDQKTCVLYYMPEEEDLENAEIEVAGLKCLMAFDGNRKDVVRDVTIEGFTFRHTARTFMENKERLLRSDWTIYRGGAVTLKNTEDCRIRNCDFDQLGGNAVFIDCYNRDFSISGCYIHDCGASGIAFVGDTESVRNPMFDYGQKASEVKDFEKGPKTDNYPTHCLVEDCLITRTGRTEKQTAGVQISMSFGIRVNHCTICNVPRAGINISEGTFGGHVIENCDVFNTVLETGDHGSFNSWGRDRYWSPSVKETSESVAAHPGRENLDMLARNELRHNRWKCDHGWDIDLDDGTSNYLIQDNLLLGGGLKLREGYHRKVVNNIIEGNTLHLHVWYANSGDVIMHNIIGKAYATIGMNQAMKADEKWGDCIDRNFFVGMEAVPDAYVANGCDSSSLSGDVSNAPAIGFHNFCSDDFGVMSERLKALAPTPPLSAMNVKEDAKEVQGETMETDGVEWTHVTGNAMSAFGGDFQMHGFAVSYDLEHLSELAKRLKRFGILPGDLLININATELKDFETLQKELRQDIHSAKLIREQKTIMLE